MTGADAGYALLFDPDSPPAGRRRAAAPSLVDFDGPDGDWRRAWELLAAGAGAPRPRDRIETLAFEFLIRLRELEGAGRLNGATVLVRAAAAAFQADPEAPEAAPAVRNLVSLAPRPSVIREAKRGADAGVGGTPIGTPRIEASGGLLVRDGRVLLERRAATAAFRPGVWDSPGGKLQPGETPEAALARELREEVGADAVAFRLARIEDSRRPGAPEIRRDHEFVVTRWRGTPEPVEGRPLRWFTIDEALSLPALNPVIAEVLADPGFEEG